MSRRMLIAMGMVLCAFAGASATTPEAPTSAPTISLDRAVHFTAPDGSDLIVAAGTYRVEQAMETQLRLVADPPQPAIEIQATATTHEETVSSPVALAIAEEGQEDEVHLVLLLPNGQGLDALVSISGTRTRATISEALSSVQLQSAVSQIKTTPQLALYMVRVPAATMPVPGKSPIYRILANGDLLEAAPSAPSQPVRVGNGWQSFKHVLAGAGTVICAVQPDGVLFWYSHSGAQNATLQWADRKIVGSDWHHFRRVFASNDGVIYAITPDGVLKWYKHLGFATGEKQWAGPVDIGTGWQKFGRVFSGCNGVIYAVTADGKLLWYKHSENPGAPNWQGPKTVGTGWQEFRALSSSCSGKIYALKKDGSLLEYHHLGWQAGTGLETPGAWAGPTTVATGWTDSRTLFASHTTYPPAAAITATPPTETVETSGPGKWVTWNYLSMHHPEIVAQALADVQTSKQSRASVAGLASEVELNDMLKTNWSAEVSRLNAVREAGTTQAEVTPRGLPGGLSLKDQVTAIPSAKPILPQALKPIAHDPFPIQLPPRNLGSVWAGQSAFAYVFITAPADGYIEGRFNLNATNRHFRIVNAKAYTGEVVNGTPAVSLTIPGGQYQDVTLDPAYPPAQISKAGFVAILAKKGQLIAFTVAFEPVGLGMTPVGDNEATLELSGATSTDINILSPNTPVATWRRFASIRARFEGINFGVLGAIDDTAITVFYDGTPCGRVIPVPASITFFNAEQQVRSVSVTAELSHPLHMQAFTVSVAPGERKQVPIPIQIDSCPNLGVEYMGRLSYAYADVVRHAEFGVTLYPNIYHWENSAKNVGSCDYTWDIFIRSDGTTHFVYSLRNRHLFLPKRLEFRFNVLGQEIGNGALEDGPGPATQRNGYEFRQPFVRDNYVRLLSAPAQVRLRCHTP